MNETHRLLREYKENRSEAAFEELVNRYIDLVYSVALRRVSGDVHRARDVVQSVFTDLARKAQDLPGDVMLGGWLHRHSCFVASNLCRSESRRQAREKEAMDNFTNESSEWNELAPALDEAIEKLDGPDRAAIVLRFFERADLRAIGVALGISEDAAQKRVSRALEKLRILLQARGVALSLAGLTTILASKSVSAAPTDWAAEISSKALATAPAEGGVIASFLALCALPFVKIAAVALLAAVIAAYVARTHPLRTATNRDIPQDQAVATSAKETGAIAPPKGDIETNATTPGGSLLNSSNVLSLTVLAADTGKVIPNVPIDYRAWEKDKFSSKKLTANRAGICEFGLSRATLTDLELTTRVEGFADTKLHWRPDRGEKIPLNYTLHLDRSVPISGRVLDEEDQPIASAKVGFNHGEDPVTGSSTESHNFSWIEVSTDADGRWRIDRIAEDVLRRIYGSAQHENYVGSVLVFAEKDVEALKQMKTGTHIFHLGNAIVVRGIVVDASANPVPKAKVLIGREGETGARRGIAGTDGGFEIKGCAPGKNLATAEAKTYAPSTIAIEIATNMNPVRLVLQPGKLLRLRVVNRAGEGIPKARAWLNTFQHNPDRSGDAEAPLTQTDFSPKTDSEGRIVWEEAPDRELTFDFHAAGYMRISELKVRPDGEEHVVTLPPALKIFGTVQDNQSGAPIPRFKIITGWPSHGFGPIQPPPQWSPIERFWLVFSDGQFEHNFEEPVVGGTKEMEFIFKVEAEGYAPFVTRVVKAEEETARFDVKLDRSAALKITVLLPTGQPAPHTDVAFAVPSEQIRFGPGGFEGNGGNVAVSTDAKGQLSWQPDENVVAIIAINPQGFAEITPSALNDSPIIQLQSWGSVVGMMNKHGKPVVGRKLALNHHRKEPNNVWVHWDTDSVTDASGRFIFPQAPPGVFSLTYYSPDPNEPRASTLVPLQELVIHPGETNTVNYDDGAIEVTAHLVWPTDFPRDPKQQIFAVIHSAFPSAPPELIGNAEGLAQWRSQPEIAEILAKARNWMLQETPGNLWKSSDVASGNYLLSASVAIPGDEGKPGMLLLQASVNVSIDPASTEDTLNLGDILLEKPPAAAATR